MTALTVQGFAHIELISMTEYDASLEDMLTVAYPPLVLTNTLGEWLAKQGKVQLRTAETEKYAHVTSFSTAASKRRMKRRSAC